MIKNLHEKIYRNKKAQAKSRNEEAYPSPFQLRIQKRVNKNLKGLFKKKKEKQ